MTPIRLLNGESPTRFIYTTFDDSTEEVFSISFPTYIFNIRHKLGTATPRGPYLLDHLEDELPSILQMPFLPCGSQIEVFSTLGVESLEFAHLMNTHNFGRATVRMSSFHNNEVKNARLTTRLKLWACVVEEWFCKVRELQRWEEEMARNASDLKGATNERGDQ